MLHKMKLQDDPFKKISDGTKTIEMRLYDEKRKKVKAGDLIEFTNIESNEKLVTRVTNVYRYKDFNELYENHDKVSLGYNEVEEANPSDMLLYYSNYDIEKYGAVGIELKLLNQDIDIKNEYATFKYRVAGIIIDDNKVLACKAKKFNGYVFPGGHVELKESSKEAVIRELKEELQADFKIEKLLCVHENLYKTLDEKIASEIVFYYVLSPLEKLPKEEFFITENDKGVIKKHEYGWIDISELLNQNVNPKDISKLIMEKLDTCNNIILSDSRR
jgi:ASC-1-like (ASCH) protein/ADP-ribose pyrophosphatase YjhB (NUDIX family)